PFLAEQSELRDEWFSQWREADPATRTAEAMQQSLRYLQMFDAISLWLCCAERTEPQTWTMPTGGRLELTPADGIRIIARPWPFEPPPLHLEASGRTVATVAYPDADALAAAESGMRTVAWELWPPG